MLRQAVGRVLALDHTIELDDLCALALAYQRFNRWLADMKRRDHALASETMTEGARWRLAPGFSDWRTLAEAFNEVNETFTRAADAFTAIAWRWQEPKPAGWDAAADALRACASSCRCRLDEIMPRPA